MKDSPTRNSLIMMRLLLSLFILSVVSSGSYAEDKPLICELNSEPRPCGKLCEPTCDDPGEKFCTPSYKERCIQQCRCRRGFVRNPETKQCIKITDCSKKCSSNSTLNLCGTSCEPTCTDPNPNQELCPKIQCTKVTQGCRCESGYLRDNESGKCVRPSDCSAAKITTAKPITCGKNEIIAVCGRACERNCEDPLTISDCASTCPEGCACKEEFLRDDETDRCVRLHQCSNQMCKAGEIHANCGKRCERTCESPVLPEFCQNPSCYHYGCRCNFDKGFVRNTKTGKCVFKEHCSADK